MSILFALGALNVAAAASGAPELYAVVAPQHDHISKCESARDPSEERTSDGMETIYTVEHRAHCRFSLRTLPTSCRMRDSIASMGDAACS